MRAFRTSGASYSVASLVRTPAGGGRCEVNLGAGRAHSESVTCASALDLCFFPSVASPRAYFQRLKNECFHQVKREQARGSFLAQARQSGWEAGFDLYCSNNGRLAREISGALCRKSTFPLIHYIIYYYGGGGSASL